MICRNCRTTINDDSKVCPNCGSSIDISKDLSSVNTNKELLDSFTNNSDVIAKNDRSNKVFTIVLCAISLIIFVTAILYFLPNKKKANNNSNSNSNVESNSNVTSNSNSNVESNSNVTSNSNSNNNSGITNDTITFKGYLLHVPNTYNVSSNADTLQLIGKNNKDIAVINISNGSYDSIKSSPQALEEYVKNRQIICNNIKTTVYNGVEFTTAEIISNGTNMILGYSKVDNGHVFEIVISNVSHTIDYTEFDTFADVVKTLKVA